MQVGTDSFIYQAHSRPTRAAHTSASPKINVQIDTLLKAAEWTNDCTF